MVSSLKTLINKYQIYYFFSSQDHIEIIVNSAGDFLFFRHRNGPWLPTLKLLHKCKYIVL